MKEPLVCAVMLTKDRPAMAARAVRAFRAQTYQNAILKVWDTSEYPGFSVPEDSPDLLAVTINGLRANEHMTEDVAEFSIGELRNRAIRWSVEVNRLEPDIFIHWDDDDLSHPDRIAEQVAHLQSSGADVVGYDELLFWRMSSEAWLLRNKSSARWGTTFCYWRKTWERKPFPDLPRPGAHGSEDYSWCNGLNIKTTSSILNHRQPRMIASCHGGNTSDYRDLNPNSGWKRVPEWDDYCRKAMEL